MCTGPPCPAPLQKHCDVAECTQATRKPLPSVLNYRPSVNLRNQWLQQDHRNFTIGAEKGMSMLQCPVLHPLKIMDPSSCFHSSMNFIWHGHRQKPDQTPQNISKWRSMFFSEKSNQIWAKCLAALTQLAFTHHLFLAAHKCGWKQSCTNSKLYKKKKDFLTAGLDPTYITFDSIMSQTFASNGLPDTTQLRVRTELKPGEGAHVVPQRLCCCPNTCSSEQSHSWDTSNQLNYKV